MKLRLTIVQSILAFALMVSFPSLSLAAPVPLPSGQKVLVVDGIGDGPTNTTVTPTVTSFLGDFTFGQVDGGGTFSEIVSGVTALAGGTFIDFAIKDNTTMAVSSLTMPNFAVITGTFDTEVPSTSAQVPSLPTGSYFNTLNLLWTVGGINVSAQFLNAGANVDGFQPVPIPSAALLFGTGIIGLIAFARRKGLLQQS